jgi:hypothetical protein
MDIFEESLEFVETMSVYIEGFYGANDIYYAKKLGPINKRFTVEYAKFRAMTKNLNEEELASFEDQVNKAEEIVKKSEKDWEHEKLLKHLALAIPNTIVDIFRATITLFATKDIVNKKGSKTSEGIKCLYNVIHIARKAISVRKEELKKEKNKK